MHRRDPAGRELATARLHDEGLDADGARARRSHTVRACDDLRFQAAVLQRFHQEDPPSEAQVQTHRAHLVHHQHACRHMQHRFVIHLCNKAVRGQLTIRTSLTLSLALILTLTLTMPLNLTLPLPLTLTLPRS